MWDEMTDKLKVFNSAAAELTRRRGGVGTERWNEMDSTASL